MARLIPPIDGLIAKQARRGPVRRVRPIERGMTAMLMAGQMHPHFLFHKMEKKTGRARSKRKDRFWSQLCTCVQSCCRGVGVRGCLRVCDGPPTDAAGCAAGLVIDSRGAVRLGSGCKIAFDQLLFPRVPLRYALPLRWGGGLRRPRKGRHIDRPYGWVRSPSTL